MLTLPPNNSKPLYWTAQCFPFVHFSRASYPVGLGGITLFWCSKLIFGYVFHFYRSLQTWLIPVYSDLRITELITGSHSLFFTRDTEIKKISATLFCRPTFKSTSHRSHKKNCCGRLLQQDSHWQIPLIHATYTYFNQTHLPSDINTRVKR